MAKTPASPPSISIGTQSTKKGNPGQLGPTDVIPVYLDVQTAKTLLTALALALSTPVNKKKKGKKGKSGKVA
jgi:hypothetical protein